MDEDLRGRMRGQRRDYTRPVHRPAPAAPSQSAPPRPPAAAQPAQTAAAGAQTPKARHRRLVRARFGRKKLILYLLLLLIILGGAAGGWRYMYMNKHVKSPVPASIQQTVGFPIYYPDPKKLPAGYSLNLGSFSAKNDVVVYSISYNGNQKVVITDQKLPSLAVTDSFTGSNIALHDTVPTNIGKAAVGAIGKQSVTSLPTNDGQWLIITAPSNINQGQLTQVLNSLTHP